MADALDVGRRTDRKPLEVDEETIVVGVQEEAVGDGDVEEVGPQVHGAGGEDARVHEGRFAVEQGHEVHPGQDVPFQIDARGDLDQPEPIRGELEDAALGDVEHPLAAGSSHLPAEGPVLDLGHELGAGPVGRDVQGLSLIHI